MVSDTDTPKSSVHLEAFSRRFCVSILNSHFSILNYITTFAETANYYETFTILCFHFAAFSVG